MRTLSFSFFLFQKKKVYYLLQIWRTLPRMKSTMDGRIDMPLIMSYRMVDGI